MKGKVKPPFRFCRPHEVGSKSSTLPRLLTKRDHNTLILHPQKHEEVAETLFQNKKSERRNNTFHKSEQEVNFIRPQTKQFMQLSSEILPFLQRQETRDRHTVYRERRKRKPSYFHVLSMQSHKAGRKIIRFQREIVHQSLRLQPGTPLPRRNPH